MRRNQGWVNCRHNNYDVAMFRGVTGAATDDAEGDVTASTSTVGVSEAAVRAAIGALTGEIMQVPSAVSAIKVAG